MLPIIKYICKYVTSEGILPLFIWPGIYRLKARFFFLAAEIILCLASMTSKMSSDARYTYFNIHFIYLFILYRSPVIRSLGSSGFHVIRGDLKLPTTKLLKTRLL